MSSLDVSALPPSKNWSARQDSPTSITYMHERDALVVLRQQLVFLYASKASTVDNQGIGHTATGSHDVRLTTCKNHSFMTKIIQHARVFRCNMTNMIRSHRPHSKLVHGKPMLWKKVVQGTTVSVQSSRSMHLHAERGHMMTPLSAHR